MQKAVAEAQELKWYRRLKIIEISGQGYGVPDLAKMFDLSQATVRIYLKRYNEDGLKGLAPDYRAGRTTILSWTKEQWLNVFNQAPSELEKLESGAQNWSQALLRQYLAEYHQVHLSQEPFPKP